MDELFFVNVSDTAKYISQTISKKDYTFIFDDDEECCDADFNLRLTCIQGWFIRCSYKSKIYFLKQCALHIKDLDSLITIIHFLYTVSSKDRIYSFSRGEVHAADMKLLDGDNRCLDKNTLEKVIVNEINWFKTLCNIKQYTFILKLLLLADYSIIISHIFQQFIEILKMRSITDYTMNLKEESSFCDGVAEEDLKDLIDNSFNRVISSGTQKYTPNIDIEMLLNKWEQFIQKYTEHLSHSHPKDIKSKSKINVKKKKSKADKNESKSVKESVNTGKASLTLDVIQVNPIWVALAIASNLKDKDLNKLKLVNDYWSFIVKEIKNELACRRGLNKQIASLEELIKEHKFEKVSFKQEDLHYKISDTTKPSLRSQFKTENQMSSSVISEVYKDYLTDFNQYSKKLPSFPRAIHIKKGTECNL